ncbi:Suppressor of Sensor Kinase (SLN1) [Mycoemilia scoparia]|uniref:Suppressor of Sensor Kinase (SLN1) n=1 Tax=Mycoemilia scoparia TaxID=417184 RepID=A0A9W8DT75_9FUNG|nr:Suppressor of Sensor Kinase (SLN1) [Mycoemilia scoparia]
MQDNRASYSQVIPQHWVNNCGMARDSYSNDVIASSRAREEYDYQERSEWLLMLKTAVASKVINQEMKRLEDQKEDSSEAQSSGIFGVLTVEPTEKEKQAHHHRNNHDIWLRIRAVLHRVSLTDEIHSLNVLRAMHVEVTLKHLEEFRYTPDNCSEPVSAFEALQQVRPLLHRVSYIESLYPTLKDLREMVPKYSEEKIQKRLKILTIWARNVQTVHQHSVLLGRWAGSSDLHSFTQSDEGSGISENDDKSEISKPKRTLLIENKKHLEASNPSAHKKAGGRGNIQNQEMPGILSEANIPFVERLLKEQGFENVFRQQWLVKLSEMLHRVKLDTITNAEEYAAMNLPPHDTTLASIIEFPVKLVKSVLLLRLQYARRLQNPTDMQLEQTLRDLRQSLSMACEIREDFVKLMVPFNGWNITLKIEDNYQQILLESLRFYLRMIDKKLHKKVERPIILEVEVMESEWENLLDVAERIVGGRFEVVNEFCYQTQLVITRLSLIIQDEMCGPEDYDKIRALGISKWISTALKRLPSRLLKLQGMIRTLHSALVNSVDLFFTDLSPILDKLGMSAHILLNVPQAWKSEGIYIIGSQDITNKPHYARGVMESCATGKNILEKEYSNCYLIVIKTDSKFEWNGRVCEKSTDLPFVSLEMKQNSIRVISHGIQCLTRNLKILQLLRVVSKSSDLGGDAGNRRSTSDKPNFGNDDSAKDSRASQSTRNLGAFPLEDPLFGRPHNPDVNLMWEAVLNSLTNMLNVLSEYPFMIRALHLEYHIRQFNESIVKRKAIRSTSPGGGANVARNSPKSPNAATPSYTERGNPKDHRAKASDPRSPTSVHFQTPQQEKSVESSKLQTDRLDSELLNTPSSSDLKLNSYPLHIIRHYCTTSCEQLEQTQFCFSFAMANFSRFSKFIGNSRIRQCQSSIVHMCIEWSGFISEDCVVSEKQTFKWMMPVLEMISSLNPLEELNKLNNSEWKLLKDRIAGCVNVLVYHLDIMGARNEKRLLQEQEQQKRDIEELRNLTLSVTRNADEQSGEESIQPKTTIPKGRFGLEIAEINAIERISSFRRAAALHDVDSGREKVAMKQKTSGRILEVTARPEDQTLRLLAQSKSNIAIRWELGRYLGGGAYGCVYMGRNLDTGEIMAVKEIRFPELGIPVNSDNRLEHQIRNKVHLNNAAKANNVGRSIIDEMEVMSRLSHINIVTYIGIEVHRDKVYLFMEYCEAGSLLNLLRENGKLNEKLVQWYALQILRGLQYLHDQGIIHRDIKPDNHSETIKLVDFGAAKTLNIHSLALSRQSKTKNGKQNNTLAGTPAYMAPEIIKNDPSDSPKLGSQDIWALGCCIVELITGMPPWSNLDNEWAIMYSVANENPPLPKKDELSDAGRDFLGKCFTRPASNRPTASDLLSHPWLKNAGENFGENRNRSYNNNYSSGYDESGNIPSGGQTDSSGFPRNFEHGYQFLTNSSGGHHNTRSSYSLEEFDFDPFNTANDIPVPGVLLGHGRSGSRTPGSHIGGSITKTSTVPFMSTIHSEAQSSIYNSANSEWPGLNNDAVQSHGANSASESPHDGHSQPNSTPGGGETSITSAEKDKYNYSNLQPQTQPGCLLNPQSLNDKAQEPSNQTSVSVIKSILSMVYQGASIRDHVFNPQRRIGHTLMFIAHKLFAKCIIRPDLKDVVHSSADQWEIPEPLAKEFEDRSHDIVSRYLAIPVDLITSCEVDGIEGGLANDILSRKEVEATRLNIIQVFEQYYWQYRRFLRLWQKHQYKMLVENSISTYPNPKEIPAPDNVKKSLMMLSPVTTRQQLEQALKSEILRQRSFIIRTSNMTRQQLEQALISEMSIPFGYAASVENPTQVSRSEIGGGIGEEDPTAMAPLDMHGGYLKIADTGPIDESNDIDNVERERRKDVIRRQLEREPPAIELSIFQEDTPIHTPLPSTPNEEDDIDPDSPLVPRFRAGNSFEDLPSPSQNNEEDSQTEGDKHR